MVSSWIDDDFLLAWERTGSAASSIAVDQAASASRAPTRPDNVVGGRLPSRRGEGMPRVVRCASPGRPKHG